MIKRVVSLFILSVAAVCGIICASSCGDGEIIAGNGGFGMSYMTEGEFVRFIETYDAGVTLADFGEIDIGDFIIYMERSRDSGENLPICIFLERYKFDLVYPNHELLTEQEFIKMLESEDIRLSASDFDGIDIEGFINYAYHVEHNVLKERREISAAASVYRSYLKWVEYSSGRNYTYLLTGDSIPLVEEDIVDMSRLYIHIWISDHSCGLAHEICYLFDFEENALFTPSGISYTNKGIYVLESTPVMRLPDDAKTIIGELLMERNIAAKGKVEFTRSRGFSLCIELSDGRIVRYPGDNTPSKIFLFINDLYGYILEIEHFHLCEGCYYCPEFIIGGVEQSRRLGRALG